MLSSVLSLFSASSTERDDPAIACPDVQIGCHVWCIAQHGRLVFAGDANGKIWVWMLASDGSSSTKIDELNAHTGTVYTMCAPREGVLFSGGMEGRLCSWALDVRRDSDIVSKKTPISSATIPSGLPVLTLAGCACGTQVFSAGADGQLRKWAFDRDAGTLYSSANTQSPAKTLFALSLVADTVVAGVGSDQYVRLWRADTLQQIASIDAIQLAPKVVSEASLFCVAVAPADARDSLPVRLLTGGNDRSVRQIVLNGIKDGQAPSDGEDGAVVGSKVQEMVPSNARDMHQGFVSAITALSARFAVSADLNGGMVLWDLERHVALKSWTAHKEGVYGLTLAPTTKAPYTVRSCCASGRIKAWLVDTQSAGVQASPGRGDGDKVTSAAGASGATGSMSNAETSNTSHGWRYARVGDEWHANYDATRTVHAWSLLFLEGNRLACGQSDGDIAIHVLPPDGVGVGKAASHGAVASQPLPHPAADGGAVVHAPFTVEAVAFLRGHSDAVHGLCWLSTACRMASSSADGSIRLWDVAAMRCVATLLHHPSKVLCCTSSVMQGCDSLFSADSSAMICAWGVNSRTGRDDADGTGSPRTQSAHHLQPTAVAREAHEGDIYALTVHADVVVSAGADQRVRLWSLGGLAPKGALAPTAHAASIFALTTLMTAANPSKALLASADAHGQVVLWDLTERAMVRRLVGGQEMGSICALASNAPGILHAGGARGDLYMWAELDGKAAPEADGGADLVEHLPTHFKAHESGGVLALIPGRGEQSRCIFSGTMGGGIAMSVVLQPGEGMPATTSAADQSSATLSSHEGCVWCLASSGNLLLSGGADHKVRVWMSDECVDESSESSPSLSLVRALTCSQVAGVVEGSDCTIFALLPLVLDDAFGVLAALGDGSVQVWVPTDATLPSGDWRCAHRSAIHSSSVLCLCSGAGSFVYCGSADCGVSQLKISGYTHTEVTLVKSVGAAHDAEVHAISACGDTFLATASADSTIRIWSVPQLAPLYSLRSGGRLGESLAHDGAVYALLCVNRRLFSGGADRTIKAWDLQTMDQEAAMLGHLSFVCALQAAAGYLYSASSDKTLAIWDLGTYARLRVLNGHRGGLYSLALHKGHACSGSLDSTIRLWHKAQATGGKAERDKILVGAS